MSSQADEARQREVCVPNIGPRGRRRRMTIGVVGIAVGGLAAAALVGFGADRVWRLVLALPFWMGALGIFQARGFT